MLEFHIKLNSLAIKYITYIDFICVCACNVRVVKYSIYIYSCVCPKKQRFTKENVMQI